GNSVRQHGTQPDDRLAVRLDNNSPKSAWIFRVRVESRVETAVGVEPGDSRLLGSIERTEASANDDFVVRLDDDRNDSATVITVQSAGAYIESPVQSSVGIQSHDSRNSGCAVVARETAANNGFPIRLNGHCVRLAANATARVKCGGE